jgi:hypothetical protein
MSRGGAENPGWPRPSHTRSIRRRRPFGPSREIERRRRIRALVSEAFRDGGILLVVFSALDAAFNAVPVTGWVVVAWASGGAVLLICGILVDPEVVQ